MSSVTKVYQNPSLWSCSDARAAQPCWPRLNRAHGTPTQVSLPPCKRLKKTTTWRNSKRRHGTKMPSRILVQQNRAVLNPPPESLFNLDENRSIKTIHLRNKNRLAPAKGGSPPPQKKSNNEVVEVASSDEDSASSSSDEGLRSAATDGDENLPSSTVEDKGMAPATANDG